MSSEVAPTRVESQSYLRKVHWGWVPNKRGQVTHHIEGTVDDLFDYLCYFQQGDKDGWGWVAGPIDPGSRRKERMSEAHLLVLDVEAKCVTVSQGAKKVTGPLPPPFLEMEKRLQEYGVKACLHTTFNCFAPSGDGGTLGPRYRVVLALSRPIKGEEIKPLGLQVADELGISHCIDQGCLELSRLYYLPRFPEERQFIKAAIQVEGGGLEVDKVLAFRQDLRAPLHERVENKGYRDVIDGWNHAHSLHDTLVRHGYEHVGQNRYLWSGSTTRTPGVVVFEESGRVYSHHPEDPLYGAHGHDPFNVFKVLECDGDFRKAIEQARNEMDDQRAGTALSEPFNLKVARIDDLLDTEPSPRQWIIPDFLPLGVVGLMIAAGGTGKSFLMLQLAVSVTTGLPWLDMEISMKGPVLMFSAEDDRPEVHRRLTEVLAQYKRDKCGFFNDEVWAENDRHLRERLFVFDRVGCDNRLTTVRDRNLEWTEYADRVVEVARQVTVKPTLIILDPLARFDGGDPNSNADATRLIECAEKIRKAVGATVLFVHHIAKGSMRDTEAGQEAARGASAFVDGSRWVGMIRTLTTKEAVQHEVPEEDRGMHVHLTTVKANYSRPWGGMWLKRQPGGVLVPHDLKTNKVHARQVRDDALYPEVIKKVCEFIREKTEKGADVTRNMLKRHAGNSGRFGVSEGKLMELVDRAIKEVHITEYDKGHKGKSLRVAQRQVAGDLPAQDGHPA